MVPAHRTLLAAVAASLLLHTLVLFVFPDIRRASPRAADARILTAKFTPSPATPETVPVSPPSRLPQGLEKAEARAAPEPPHRAPASASPVQRAPASAAPSAAPSVPHVQEGPLSAAPSSAEPLPRAPEPAAAPEMRGAPAATGTSGVPGAAGAPKSRLAAPKAPAARSKATDAQGPVGATGPAAAGEADTGTLDQYRLALIGVARRYKRYPSQAMEMGWQGRVEVRLIIGANGFTQSVSVRTSSGYEILDKQALDIVVKAKPLAPIPASLRGREFTIDIPVIFDLQSG